MSPPIEWDQCRLNEVTVPTSTWNPRRDPRPSIRYIDVSAVSRDELRIVSEAIYSVDNAPSRARKFVEAGDTIFATVRPSLRRIAQIPASLDGEIVSTAFCVLRPDPQTIDTDFLYFAIQLESVMEGIAAMESGASYPAVRDADVLDQVVPLPPLPEQRQIAAVLNTIRTALLHQAQCEASATVLKRATMRTLFTRGLRGEAQKETEIGPVPESWPLIPLAKAVLLQRGFDLPVSHRRNGDIPVFGSNGIVGYHHHQPTYIPVPGVMVGRSGSVGKVSFSVDPYWPLNTTLFATEFFGNDERFIAYFLDQFDFSRFSSGVSVPTLNRNSFASVTIGVPPVDEQREIVTILAAIDRKIDLHRRKRAVLDDLFKALLHKLMTGEIRVADLDLPPLTTRTHGLPTRDMINEE